MIRGKLRLAMFCGMALIFGTSAVAVGKKRPKKEKVEKAAPDAADKALGGPQKIDVKCNIPPIKVNVQSGVAAAAPKTDSPAKAKAAKTKGPLIYWPKVARDLLLTLIFSLLGLVIALFGYFVYHWIVPFDLRKELEVDQNTSLGIVAGSIILGLCIIVAAAIASP